VVDSTLQNYRETSGDLYKIQTDTCEIQTIGIYPPESKEVTQRAPRSTTDTKNYNLALNTCELCTRCDPLIGTFQGTIFKDQCFKDING
jgi:hypothetical protein